MHRANNKAAQVRTACGHRPLRQTHHFFLSGLSHSALTAGLLIGTLAASPALAQTANRTPAPAENATTNEVVLPPIVVSSEPRLGEVLPAYAGGQFAEGGSLGILGTRSVLNTPFSTVNYTAELIANQQARTAADTLINDSSVRTTTGSNGFDDTFQIRGFGVSSGDTGFNGLYGLIASNRAASQYIERIQLLKGPAAFANGIPPGGSVGGSINIVTKRATDDPFTVVTPTFMSGGNVGTEIDFNRRFGTNKEWGVRFNGVARTGEASIDDGDSTVGLGALSVDYRGDRFRWALDAITQNDNTKNFRPQMTIRTTPTVVPFIPPAPNASSNWYPGTYLQQRDHTIASFVEFDVTDWLTAYAGFGHREGTNRQTFPDSRVAGFSSGMDQGGNFRLLNAYYDSASTTDSGNAGVKAKFDTGFINHSLNLGVTGFWQENSNAYLANTAAQSVPSNIYSPSPLPLVNGTRRSPGKASDVKLTSVAVADTMSVLDERILLTLGVRHQEVKQKSFNTTTGAPSGFYEADATTPLAGIVLKPWENVSVYANYAEGLSQGSVVGAGFANTGAVLAPFKSDQQEVGVKVDWGRITTTAALFQISRPNIITTADNSRAYDGEQRNRGLELAAYGEIIPGLRGFGGVTFLNPELTKVAPTAAGLATKGNDAAGVPDMSISAGLDWDTPWVQGLSLNGRVIYTSGSYLTTANTLKFPDWTRVDIGARYETKVKDHDVTVRLNVENLFDKNYWLTTGNFVTVGSPRTYLGSVSVKF